jgi:uncharacterized protein YkwD
MKRLLALVLVALPSAQAQSLDLSHAAEAIVAGSNGVRRANGLPSLSIESRLGKTARDFAEHLAKTDNLSHEADGRQPADRAKRHGYDYCMVAENIGYQFRSDGFKSVSQLSAGFVTGWENSPEHRRNLLDREATETGVGLARSAKTGRHYAVQLFGRPASKSLKFSVANESSRGVEYRIGDERYTLPPRSVRTHDVCTQEALSLAGNSVVPKAGERLVVVETKEGPRLRKP